MFQQSDFYNNAFKIVYSDKIGLFEHNDVLEVLHLHLSEYHVSTGGSPFETNIIFNIMNFHKKDLIQNNCSNRSIDYSRVNFWSEIKNIKNDNIIKLFINLEDNEVITSLYTSVSKCKTSFNEELLCSVPKHSFLHPRTIANYYNFLMNGEFYENQKPYHKYH